MLNLEKLKDLVRKIAETREDEIGCEECYAELDRFVDYLLEGKNAEEVMPMVHHHLDMCRDCHEEFEALLSALDTVP